MTQVRTVYRSLIKGRFGSESEAQEELEPRPDLEENLPVREEGSFHLEEEDVDLAGVVRVSPGRLELMMQGHSQDCERDIVPP